MTTVAGLALRSPVLVAAGCGGTGRELLPYLGPTGLGGLGAFVTRTITLDPRPGGPAPRVLETPSGLLHATGLPNPGLEPFLATELPWLLRHDARVVVSITGRTVEEHAEVARRLGRAPGVAAVELNLADPEAPPAEASHQAAVVAAVRRDLPDGVPVLAKIRPDLLRVVATAQAVLDAGAGAVVVGQSQPAAMPDGRPAGLAGPAVGPLALRCVSEVGAALPGADVVACGGVATGADVRAFLAAGAVAVQVGSALLHDPTTAGRLARELADHAAEELSR